MTPEEAKSISYKSSGGQANSAKSGGPWASKRRLPYADILWYEPNIRQRTRWLMAKTSFLNYGSRCQHYDKVEKEQGVKCIMRRVILHIQGDALEEFFRHIIRYPWLASVQTVRLLGVPTEIVENQVTKSALVIVSYERGTS